MLLVRVRFEDKSASIILGEALKMLLNTSDKILVFCIGTDKCICDSLGPLIGSLLIDSNIPLHIFGVLYDPIHLGNIETRIAEIKDKFSEYKIIAIDACLGDGEEVGFIKLKEGSISAGEGIGRKCTPVGHYAIEAIIERKEVSEYIMKLPVRLRYVYKMAIVIRDAFKYAYGYDIKS